MVRPYGAICSLGKRNTRNKALTLILHISPFRERLSLQWQCIRFRQLTQRGMCLFPDGSIIPSEIEKLAYKLSWIEDTIYKIPDESIGRTSSYPLFIMCLKSQKERVN